MEPELDSAEDGSLKQSPLKGIRILDFTRILSGPYCTMILGDLGAEIIKIEKPLTGDESRQFHPPQTLSGVSCYFISVNRNKKSIVIDLKKGKDVVFKLVKNSDVLIENFVPGTMTKLGLGYKELREINPQLIYCSISGYGATGPYAKRGGYDMIAGSIGGFLHITGPRGGEPCKVGVPIIDLTTGLYLHGAILAALFQRHATNKGQKIELDLLSTQVGCLVNVGSSYLNGGVEAIRLGTAHESIVPYESFPTNGGRWITIAAGSNELFNELCDAIGLSFLKTIDKYSTNPLRVVNRKELTEILRNQIQTKTCAEWLEIFKNCKFAFGPVNNLQEVFSDPQVKANKLVEDIGVFKVVGPVVKYSTAENKVRLPPPELGQHTREILKTVLQMSDSDIEELFGKAIVG